MSDRLASALLTDQYQLTMAYGYWLNNCHNKNAVFDLFTRKNPFSGAFTVLAGIADAVQFVKNFKFRDEEIEYIRTIMPNCNQSFFSWLREVTTDDITIYAIPEGTIVFPRVPFMRLEGPLAITQILETRLLNTINFASLVATKAARIRIAAGTSQLLEFGARRAQGPDGALSASRYSYQGGFDATSNVLAGKLYGIPVKGTMAHAFVSSFTGVDEIEQPNIIGKDGCVYNLVELTLGFQRKLQKKYNWNNINKEELAGFIAYAIAFPNGFLALVDTYNTLQSGVPNFLAVALALKSIGFDPTGIRLDSGDLAALSKEARKMFNVVAKDMAVAFKPFVIVGSNDLDESSISKLISNNCEINVFGVGTRLATCEDQPALGGVYKLVEANGLPRMKKSEESAKAVLPGKKVAYRLFDESGAAVLDLLTLAEGDNAPRADKSIICVNSVNERVTKIVPARVEILHTAVFDKGRSMISENSISDAKERLCRQMKQIPLKHTCLIDSEPYSVCVSEKLFHLMSEMMKH